MVSYRTVIADLRSGACRCGKLKRAKQFFCSECYWSLPEAYRRRLWLRARSQNAICTIYTRALAFLGWLKPSRAEVA